MARTTISDDLNQTSTPDGTVLESTRRRVHWDDTANAATVQVNNDPEQPVDYSEVAPLVRDLTKYDIHDKARRALRSNREFIAALPVTNAAALAQVTALTRQMNEVIRLLLAKDDAEDLLDP